MGNIVRRIRTGGISQKMNLRLDDAMHDRLPRLPVHPHREAFQRIGCLPDGAHQRPSSSL
jgi:hypothetical protein